MTEVTSSTEPDYGTQFPQADDHSVQQWLWYLSVWHTGLELGLTLKVFTMPLVWQVQRLFQSHIIDVLDHLISNQQLKMLIKKKNHWGRNTWPCTSSLILYNITPACWRDYRCRALCVICKRMNITMVLFILNFFIYKQCDQTSQDDANENTNLNRLATFWRTSCRHFLVFLNDENAPQVRQVTSMLTSMFISSCYLQFVPKKSFIFSACVLFSSRLNGKDGAAAHDDALKSKANCYNTTLA